MLHSMQIAIISISYVPTYMSGVRDSFPSLAPRSAVSPSSAGGRRWKKHTFHERFQSNAEGKHKYEYISPEKFMLVL